MATPTPSPEVAAHNEQLKSLSPHDPRTVPFSPIPPPPSPEAFCSLSVVRGARATRFPADDLVLGALHGTFIDLPTHSFLIEKKAAGGEVVRVMFELGLRNTEDLINPIFRFMASMWTATSSPGAAQILEKTAHIPLSSISTIIFGHTHFDHVGNLAEFPSSVSMLLGPGSPVGEALATAIDVPMSVLEGRSVEVLGPVPAGIPEEGSEWKTIGSMKGVDYFGDGSLWLLDAPGHTLGHIAALVRTSTAPPAYHLLGSDTAHVVTLLNAPSPFSTTQSLSTSTPHSLCPCHCAGLFLPSKYDPSADPHKLGSMHADLAKAYDTIAQVARMEQEEDVSVFLAHDTTMDRALPLGDFVKLGGSIEELRTLKTRDRTPNVIAA